MPRNSANGLPTFERHLIDDYTLNHCRLQERNIEFEQTIELLSRTLSNQELVTGDG